MARDLLTFQEPPRGSLQTREMFLDQILVHRVVEPFKAFRWLMLSDVFVASAQYDLAEELCKRCLVSNTSCAKAWEFLGLVKEKEMSYQDAASHYGKAWKFESEASAAVGYRLSFNHLKAKRYVEAINVCHKVLSLYPDYPRIREDVLDKARESLRL